MATEFPPVAVCTICGDITFDANAINQRCGRQPSGKRCKGVYGSALNDTDWKSCNFCDASGKQASGMTCEYCNGTGWRFARRNR